MKKVFYLTLLTILFASQHFITAQDINLLRFNNSVNYAGGSGVSVIINPTGVFELNNQFILQLSSSGGLWTSPTTLSTLDEFYVPAINSTLPNALTPGSYKLRIISTQPKDTVVTESFNVVGGTGIVPSILYSLINPNANLFNCSSEKDCLNSLAYFGTLNRAEGATSNSINQLNNLKLEICNFDNSYSYEAKIIDIKNSQLLNLNIINSNQVLIPSNLQIGTYIFELTKSKGGFSSVRSSAFLLHGNATNLGNTTSENICVGLNVAFNIDISMAGIGRNYPGSKYTIDFGDETPFKEYTHAQLIKNPNITKIYNTVSCSTPNGYFTVNKQLLNKGISGNCTEYSTNGNGAQKNINTSLAPSANFNLAEKQCINNQIVIENTTILGQYGASGTNGNGYLDAAFFTWAYKKPGTSNFIDVPNSWIVYPDYDLLIPSNQVNIPGCWEFQLKAVNQDFCETESQKIKTIKIESVPVASFTFPPNVVLCSGNTITFTNTSNVANQACQEPTYLWTITPITDSGATSNGFTPQPGSYTTKNISIKFTQPGSYNVSLTVTNSCGSSTVTKTIENLGDPSVNFNPANASICEDAPADLLIDFNTTYKPNYSKGVFAPKSYEWIISGTDVTASDYAFTGGTNASDAFPKIIFKAYKTFAIKVKVNGSCNRPDEAIFNLTLKETPIITNSNLTQTICSGTSTTAIPLTSSVSGTTFSWEVIKTTNITTTINNGNTTTIPGITINNNSTTSGTITYRVTPTANGCTGSTKDIVITVNPVPVVLNLTETICSGYAFNKTPTDGNGNIVPTGTKYSWPTPVSNPAGAITGGSAQSGVSSISQTLTNTTNTVATLTYTITPQSGTSGSCAGQPFTVIITVKPTPVLTQPDNQTICNNLLTSAILFSSNVANTTFTWTNTNPTIGLSASGNGNIGSFKAINTGTTNQTATITVTPTANGCSGTAKSFTITVNPTPQFSKQPESSNVCINGSAKTLSVAFTNGTGTPSYQWFSNTINSNTGGTEISGAINDSYAPATNVVGTAYYYCVISLTGGGCSSITSNAATVTVNPLPTISTEPLVTQKICVGGVIQPLTVAYVGGTGTATYQWYSNTTNSNTGGTAISGAKTASFTPAAFNSVGKFYFYCVVNLDGNGCGTAISQVAEVNVLPDPVVTAPLATQTVCQSTTPANLSVSATGGEGNFSYQWYSNNTNSNVGGSAISEAKSASYIPPTDIVGTKYYYCSVTQTGLGCATLSAVAEVKIVPAPQFSKQPESSSICINGAAKTLSVAFTNGTGTPSYQWFSNTINSNTGGTEISGAINDSYAPATNVVGTTYYYCVISLTGGGCSSITSNTATVTVNSLPIISNEPLVTQKICVGGVIQPLTVAYVGGTGTATYQWYSNTTNSNTGGTAISGAKTASFTPAAFNSVGKFYFYCVVNLDGNGCGTAVSQAAEVNVLPDPVVTAPLATQTVCQSTTPANLSVSATGGEGNFSYQWYSNNTNSNVGGSLITDAKSASYIPPTDIVGTKYYYCSVTQTGLGCATLSAVAEVKIVPAPQFSKQPESSSVCINGAAKTLSVAFTNGTGTPSYQWFSNTTNSNTGGTEISGAINDSYAPATNVVGTTYYYCVISLTGGGCSSITSNTATVTVNPLPTISTEPLVTQKICVGGVIQPLTVAYVGGTGTATYQWYSNSTNSNSGGTAISGAKTASFTPAAFNSVGKFYFYCVVNLDGNGCGTATSLPAEVVVMPDPIVTKEPISEQTVCQGTTSEPLIVFVSGGVGIYNYQWYEQLTTGSEVIVGARDSIYFAPTDIVGVKKYYCLVTQSGIGCSVTSNISTLTVKKAPTFTLQPIPATYCKNEQATSLKVAYIDGVGTAQYQWYENNTNEIANGIAINGAKTDTYTPETSTAGTKYYYCIITLPTGGCSSLTSNIAKIIVNQFPVIRDYSFLIGSGKTFSVKPSDDINNIVPSGTTYSWESPVLSVANGISGMSATTDAQTIISQTLTNNTKTPVIAVYNVTPANGICTGGDFKINVTVNPPLNPNTIVSPVSCFEANDGSISIDIQGGIPPYSVLWTGPNNFTSKSENISNLKPGDYQLTITDNGGFPFTEKYTITEPQPISITTLSKKDVSCFGAADASISIEIAGGNGGYKYLWNKNNEFFSLERNISNLSPGLYSVAVSDKNNCGPAQMSYEITQPDPLTIKLLQKSDNKCAGDRNGEIVISVSGGTKIETIPGTLDYIYEWQGPAGFSSQKKDIENLGSGLYKLSVSDLSGCTSTFEVSIDEPDSIKIQYDTTPITCYGADDASITLHITGGIKPYRCEWSNLASGTEQYNLSAADYTIVVTDSNNCQSTITINIPEAPIFRITPVIKQISCHGANDGSIKLHIEGGQGKVSLKWDDSNTVGNERNNLGPGTYTVTISDGKPCYIKRSFIIQEPFPLNAEGIVENAFDCENTNSGKITLNVTGGTEPYSFLWSNGENTKNIEKIGPGNYFVIITDSRSCETTKEFTIKRQLPIKINITREHQFDCNNKKINQICTAMIAGGIPPYQVHWSSGKTSGNNNEIMTTDQEATIIVTVTDALGCTMKQTFNTAIPNIGIAYHIQDCNTQSYLFDIDFPEKLFTDIHYYWDFGDGYTSTLRNPQHTFIKPGTYKIIASIKSNECNADFEQRFFVDSIPVLNLDKPANLCPNDSVTLSISGADSYTWSNGSTADNITIKNEGSYSVKGTTKNGCYSTLEFNSKFYENINYTISTDKETITPNDAFVRFWSQEIPLTEYYWNFGDGQHDVGNNIYHQYKVERGGYLNIELNLVNPNGCKEYATKKIWLSLDAMPNIFVPDAGGDNRVFLKGWNLQVFNSIGVLLYKGTDGWDGTYKNRPVSSDTYYYVVSVYTINGTESKPGFVTVVR